MVCVLARHIQKQAKYKNNKENGKEKPQKQTNWMFRRKRLSPSWKIRRVVFTWGSQRTSRNGYAEIGKKGSFRQMRPHEPKHVVKPGGVYLEYTVQEIETENVDWGHSI